MTAIPTKEGKITEMKGFLKIAAVIFLAALAISLSGIQLCSTAEGMADIIGFIDIFGLCYLGFAAYSYFEYATWGMDLKLFSAYQDVQAKALSNIQGKKSNTANPKNRQSNRKYNSKKH